MAVGFSNTNKPLNPRGQDASPKGYNRAKLFSGKALDFDGVNDYVEIDSFSGTLSDNDAWTLCGYFKANENSGTSIWFSAHTQYNANVIRVGVRENELGLFYDDSHLPDSFIGTEDLNNDEWHFIALSRPQGGAGTEVTLYVNGIASGTLETDITWNVATKFSIGQEWDGGGASDFFDGQISGVKVFSTALTTAQVADLYNNPEKVVPTGVDNTALKLWLPMQEGAGTYCINGADPLGADEYNGAGSFDSATGWTLNTGFSIGGGSLSCDGSQTAATSAYYNISSVASSLAMVQFTLSNVTAGQIQLAFFGASGTTTKWYTADGTYTEYVEVAAGHNGNTGFIANADFVGDIDNLTLKVVNTGAISGATWTHGIGAPIAQTAVIDWNKETTGAGTTMLLPQGLTTGRDITGVNLFENVRKQGALNLDGNSWAEVHDNASLDMTNLSLECWFDNTNAYDSIRYLFDKSAGSVSGFELRLVSQNSVQLVFRNLSTISKVATIPISGWVHVVGIYDGSDIIVYVDGTLAGSVASSGSIGTNDDALSIGGDNSFAPYRLNKPIAQPRIYNRALTAEEVLQNYNSGKNTYTNN